MSVSYLRLCLSAGLLAGLTACNAPDAPPAPALPSVASTYKLTTADAAFIQQLDEMDQTQIAIANLAATHSNSDVIKAFATKVEGDHTTNQKAVAKIASDANLTVASKIDAADQDRVDSFSHLYGAPFDRLFLREVVSIRTADLDKAITTAKAAGGTPDIKTLAADTDTLLTDHTARARDLMGDRTFRHHAKHKRNH